MARQMAKSEALRHIKTVDTVYLSSNISADDRSNVLSVPLTDDQVGSLVAKLRRGAVEDKIIAEVGEYGRVLFIG